MSVCSWFYMLENSTFVVFRYHQPQGSQGRGRMVGSAHDSESMSLHHGQVSHTSHCSSSTKTFRGTASENSGKKKMEASLKGTDLLFASRGDTEQNVKSRNDTVIFLLFRTRQWELLTSCHAPVISFIRQCPIFDFA